MAICSTLGFCDIWVMPLLIILCKSKILKKIERIDNMIFRTPIETDRLLLKDESLQDFKRFYALCADPEVMQYIGDGSVYHWTKKVALGKYKDRIFSQAEKTFGNLAVCRKDCDLYIGWCGVCYSKFLDHIELGYRYCRDSWGQGYATEGARALLCETYHVTDIDEIRACAHPDNTASIRVLEKLGFDYAYSKLSKPTGRNISVYRIGRKTCMSTALCKGDRDWKVYLIRCADNSLYCGITRDLNARIATHNAGKGAKYTKSRLPVTLVSASYVMSKSDALKLEHHIKKQPAHKKRAALWEYSTRCIKPKVL